MKRFGVMLDCSRNAVMKPQEVKNFARILKSMGYNMLQLYTEDTYEIEGEPYFGYMRGRYSVEELQDIVAYCASIDVEVIPCIQTLAHLNQIFHWVVYHPIIDTADTLLADEERTYTLIDNMFKSLRKSFTSEWVHIGMDEAHMLGLGEYLHKHGFSNRFDILLRHLKKVIEIAKKYNFKPIMWSDMFFKFANGVYHAEDPTCSEEVRALKPKDVGLVYWDYYHTDKSHYQKMMKAHLDFEGESWFAGGAWCWEGFASGNEYSLKTMLPAMEAAKEYNIDNIMLTMWGDNGKECSFYSLLPSLFAIRKYYDGERDMEKIKADFQTLTGESYDAMFALDEPNYVGSNHMIELNVCKHMLYNDPFNGYLDSTAEDGVAAEYKTIAEKLSRYGKTSNYGYVFESAAALCKVLELKYDLGKRTREAYKAKDKTALAALITDYAETIDRLETFYQAFRKLWYKENKANGFDVQDLRLGGLKQRLLSCRERLLAYLQNEIDCIEELEENLLCYHGGKDTFEKKAPHLNNWAKTASANVI